MSFIQYPGLSDDIWDRWNNSQPPETKPAPVIGTLPPVSALSTSPREKISDGYGFVERIKAIVKAPLFFIEGLFMASRAITYRYIPSLLSRNWIGGKYFPISRQAAENELDAARQVFSASLKSFKHIFVPQVKKSFTPTGASFFWNVIINPCYIIKKSDL